MSSESNVSQGSPNWLVQYLALPLVVGLILAIVGGLIGFVLPRFFADEKELSYTILGPNRYFDNPAVGNVTVQVNGVQVTNVTSYSVRVWNSGDVPLKNVPVRLVFTPDRDDFKILTIGHQTRPPYEFGKILQESTDGSSVRFVYDLLNPGDEDTITLLVTQSPPLQVFAKAEGLAVRASVPQEDSIAERYLPLLSGILAGASAIVATILRQSVLDDLVSGYARSRKRRMPSRSK